MASYDQRHGSCEMHSTDSITASGEPACTQPANAVTARGVGRRFGRTWALAHIDIEIKQGESVLLVGHNGSGKTTLLRLLCGLLRPSTGDLRLFGSAPQQQPFEVRPRLTLVSHRTYLYEQLTALEHVRLWMGLAMDSTYHSTPAEAQERRAKELLETVGLEQRAADPAVQFSAGMRKRLSLLRTQIEDPDLILLDEPFSALDPAGQDMVTDWLAQLRARGKTLIVASHALEQASKLCAKAIVLHTGQIVWRGAAADVTAGLLTHATKSNS